jgi:signal peptidase
MRLVTNTQAAARTINEIVRVVLLLLVPVLCGVAAFLVDRGGAVALVGVAAIGVMLLVTASVFIELRARDAVVAGQRALLIVAITVFAGLAVFPQLGVYRTATVLSNSMRPTFAAGDLIVIRPEPLRDVRVGQVISYRVPTGAQQVETHRVLRVLQGGNAPIVQTKGDANNWRDPWTAQLHGGTAWKLSFVVPYAGYAINALRSRSVHLAAIFVVPALLALLFLNDLWRPSARRREPLDARG